jgi:hypothetical protein
MEVELGQEIVSTIAHTHPRIISLIGLIIKIAQAIKEVFKRKNHSD